MSEEEGLKENIRAIQGFTDEQLKTYRAKISSNYLSVSKIIDFIKKQTLENNQNIFQDTVRAIKDFKELFIKTIEGSPSQAEKNSFSNSVTNLNKKVQEYQTNEAQKISLIEEALKNLEEEKSKIPQKIEEVEIIKKDIETLKISLESTIKALQEEHNFEDSQNYWKMKKDTHREKAMYFFKVFIGVMLVALLLITILLFKSEISTFIFSDNNTTEITKSSKDEPSTINNDEVFKYLKYLSLMSLFVWLVRIILKLMFSNFHLLEEANEKETMISTYLALINEGGGLTDKDKSMILEAIFRPSSNGLIKDETNVTLLDAIKALKDK